MAERSLVDYVLNGMRGRWKKPVKHADAFTPGVADLSAWLDKKRGTVWIELKAIPKWPTRPLTSVTFGLDELQRDFLWERHGWLFVRVGREYLLFGCTAAKHLVDKPAATQATLQQMADGHWKNSVNWKEFERCLKLPN